MLSRHRVRHHRCKTAIRRVPRCAVTRCMRVPPARAKSCARRCAPGRSGRPSSSTRTLAVCAVRASIRTWQSRHRVWHVMLANFETPIRQRHPRLTHARNAGQVLTKPRRGKCRAWFALREGSETQIYQRRQSMTRRVLRVRLGASKPRPIKRRAPLVLRESGARARLQLCRRG